MIDRGDIVTMLYKEASKTRKSPVSTFSPREKELVASILEILANQLEQL